MRESKIERHLRIQVKRAGGECVKIAKVKNFPDRVVLMPGAAMCFVELKAPGKKPTTGQARCHAKLWKMGFPVAIIDSKELADSFVRSFSKRWREEHETALISNRAYI